MLLKIIFLVSMYCKSYMAETEETIFEYKDYKERVHRLLKIDSKGNLATMNCNIDQSKERLEYILKSIYDHFKGHNEKLSSFTSLFLVYNDFCLYNILLTCVPDSEIQHNIHFKEDETQDEDVMLDETSLPNEEDFIQTPLEIFIFSFDEIIKDYSYDNLVKVFIPRAKDIPYLALKAQRMEFAYFLLKMENDKKFYSQLEDLKFNTMS